MISHQICSLHVTAVGRPLSVISHALLWPNFDFPLTRRPPIIISRTIFLLSCPSYLRRPVPWSAFQCRSFVCAGFRRRVLGFLAHPRRCACLNLILCASSTTIGWWRRHGDLKLPSWWPSTNLLKSQSPELLNISSAMALALWACQWLALTPRITARGENGQYQSTSIDPSRRHKALMLARP